MTTHQSETFLDCAVLATEQALLDQQSPFENFNSAFSLADKVESFCEMANITQLAGKRDFLQHIDRHIALIDELLDEQVNAILHHNRLQDLEASWRGLQYLVEQSDGVSNVKIRFLDVSWNTLVKDLDRAFEFDQSQIFRKVYNEEFGIAGGQPFGVLLGDYTIRHSLGGGYKTDDVNALRQMSQVAAAAFAPFITAADPALFGLDNFYELGMPHNLNTVFEQPEYIKWNGLRESEDSRFLGMVLPKILMRKPYTANNYRDDGFVFNEDITSLDNSDFLWGNAVYAYGAVLVREFGKSGWFSDIRGSANGINAGGVVTDIPLESFSTDHNGTASKFVTDVLISDTMDKAMCDYGFIPLCHSKGTEYAVFYSNSSLHKPPTYDSNTVNTNAKISSMLHYILSMSRFAHYVKVIGRTKIGSFATSEELEDHIQEWLLNYTMDGSNLPSEMRAKYPLSEARVEIKDVVGKPGKFSCVIYLKPHTQHDKIVSAVKLVTELVEAKV